MVNFLLASVMPKTRDAYLNDWKKWEGFLGSICLTNAASPFLTDVATSSQSETILQFIMYLYDLGLRGKQVTRCVSSIKQMFVFNLCSVEAFDSPIVRQGCKASVHSVSERRVQARLVQDRSIIPISVEFIRVMRNLYWKDVWATKDDYDRKAVYLAAALCYDTGARISSFCLREYKGPDHCVRCNQVVFVSVDRVKYHAGEPFRNAMKLLPPDQRVMECVEIQFLTQKECIKSGMIVARDPCMIMRRTADEIQFINDLTIWALLNGASDDDEITSRRFHGRKKTVTRAEVAAAIKSVASSLGLDPSRVSTSSLRKGYATSALNNGVSRDLTSSRGGWNPSSSVLDDHYAVNMNVAGGLSLSPAGYGLEDMIQLSK